MTILLTGGRGKTASRLGPLLAAAGHTVLITSRSAPSASPTSVRFDWLDPSTHTLPFTHPLALASPITAIYLVGTDIADTSAHILPFIAVARAHGVRRFVAVSAWERPADAAGVLMAPVHAELARLGAEEGVEWAVVRPQFMMQNFSEHAFLKMIRDEEQILAGAADGKLAWVSAGDVARVAFRALVDETPWNSDVVVTGDEVLDHYQIAEIFTTILARPITYIPLDRSQHLALLQGTGMDAWMAGYMADLDQSVAAGEATERTDVVRRITGRAAQTFEDYVREDREVWG